MNQDCIRRSECRICGHRDLKKILDLGQMPPANAFLNSQKDFIAEKKFPLEVYFCSNCSLVQLLDIVNPEILFRRYDYLTSASKPLADHFIKMGQDLAQRFIKSKSDLVIEIGSNDGILLGAIKGNSRILGIEPAKNVAALAVKNGIETISEFFNKNLAQEISKKYGLAKIIIANNVVAHIDALKDLFGGIKALIGDEGFFIFEVHWVGNLVDEGGFDQIYHEHLSYFSLLALENLVKPFDLKIFDVELVPIHGASLRVYVGKNIKIKNSVEEFLNKEKNLDLDKSETYLRFSEKASKNRTALKDLLLGLKKEGKKIVGYGAPAKGNTLLNYCGINDKVLDYLIDTTPFKQGKLTPGTHIPIYSPEKLNYDVPDYLLLLAWNYAEAILKKEVVLRERGAKFIIPVPEVKIV